MARAINATAAASSWSKVYVKGSSTDAQLKKLKDLYNTLHDSTPESFDNKSTLIASLSNQLSQQDLLFHKDREVRVNLACCIAELLRLTAPNSPFEKEVTQAIFRFFLAVLAPQKGGGLGKPDGALFSELKALLECIVMSQTIFLICDLEETDSIIIEYFTHFFAIIRPGVPKEVEFQMAKLLSLLITDESPMKIIELLMGLFHPTVKSTNPAASHLASLVFNEAANIDLQTHITKHYSEAMTKAMRNEDSPELETSLQRIHSILINIYKSEPAALDMIIPQLEEGIKAQNDTVREACVKTLGHVFTERKSIDGKGGDAVQKFSSTWKAWKGRCLDKSVNARTLWTEAIRGLLVNHPKLIVELEECIILKIQDPDDKVRLSMIQIFGTLDYETLCHRIPMRLLLVIADRLSDPKELVRLEAMEVIGRAYSLAFPEMDRGESNVMEKFGWIPDQLINTFQHCGYQVATASLQKIFVKYIVPSPALHQEDSIRWTNRLLFVYEALEDKEKTQMFIKLCNLMDRRNYFTDFISTCKKFNGGIMNGSQDTIVSTKKLMIRHISLIASRFPDHAHAAKELNDFAKMNDDRAYKLITTIMDAQIDLKTYTNAMAAFSKKMQISSSRTNTTMISFALMASFPFVGQSSIPTIVSRLQQLDFKKDQEKVEGLTRLIKAMCDVEPAMFRKHTILLLQAAFEHESSKTSAIAPCLLALAKLQNEDVNNLIVPIDTNGIRKLRKLINSDSYREAKYAAKLLSILSKTNSGSIADLSIQTIQEFCEEMAHDLSTVPDNQLASSMAALTQFVKYAAESMIHLGDTLVTKVVQDILLKPWTEENRKVEGEEIEEPADWIEDSEINADLQKRMNAIKFITQRCIAHKEESEVVQMLIKPVLRLLVACVRQGQPLVEMNGIAGAKSRIRGVAASSIIRLARNTNCEKNIGQDDFHIYAASIQDPTWQNRVANLQKLLAYCSRRECNLPSRYYCLPFLVARDPDDEVRPAVQQFCVKLGSAMTPELRLKYFGVGLARLMHLLCSFPPPSQDDDDDNTSQLGGLKSLEKASSYIYFYLDCCAEVDNLACLYHIAQRCKGYKHISGDEDSTILYRMADLTMICIKKRADALGCTVDNYAGKVNLPDDLFLPMPNRAAQKAVYESSYLTQEEIDHLQAQPNKKISFRVQKRIPVYQIEDDASKKKAKRDAKSKGAGAIGKKTKGGRKRKVREDEEEDDFGSELSDDMIEEDDDGASATSNDEDEKVDVSEDEEIDTSIENMEEGRSNRIKEKQRKEKLARNEDRKRRRLEKEAAAKKKK